MHLKTILKCKIMRHPLKLGAVWTSFGDLPVAELIIYRCLSKTQSHRIENKKHLKNVWPIRHCEPPHAHSPGVATGTVAHRLRIDVHDDNNDNDNA